MVIYDSSGHECGKILGRSELKTDDESLEKIWKEYIVQKLPHLSDTQWETAVIESLADYGYLGEQSE
jgi:hypothetical protein